MHMYIVLALLVFMIVMFFMNKVPYGVTTMTCCTMLALTGVMKVGDAFAGLSNKITILVACMFCVASAFGKTSLIDKIRGYMDKVKSKSGVAFVAFLFLISIILAQLMGRTAIVSILALFLVTLNDNDEICPSRMIFVAFAVVAAWSLKVPLAMGAIMAPMANAYYAGIVNNPEYLLMPWDFLKVSLVPCILLTIYCFFAWRLIPKHPIDTSGVKEVKTGGQVLARKTETIINTVFAVVIIGFILGGKLGDIMYVIPAIGVLVLIYTKCMTVKEAVASLTSDMVWMIAGVLVMSDAIGKSGVGELIGKGVQTILGANSSGFFILLVFTSTTLIMTTFMSNTGTAAVLTPIAGSLALAANLDPRGIVLCVNIANVMAVAFPSGSAECALAYAVGQHDPAKLLKFTVPYLVIAAVSLAFFANYFFPVYR